MRGVPSHVLVFPSRLNRMVLLRECLRSDVILPIAYVISAGLINMY